MTRGASTNKEQAPISPTRCILVPLDGSPFGEAALPAAVTAAERLDADLELVTVVPDRGEWGVEAVIQAFSPSDDYGQWIEQYLEARADDLAEVLGRAVTYEVRSGSAREALLEFAHERRSAMIVMSTHGRGPLTRAWLGSVADAIQRESPVPVLLVRPPSDREEHAPELTDLPAFQRVLVPMDGSRHSEESLRWAFELSNGTTTYTLLQIVTLPIANAAGPMVTGSGWIPGLLAATKAEGAVYLEEQAAPFRRRGADVTTEIVADGPPAAEILAYAETNEMELIAIGSHGRGGLSRAMLGSVADKVVRNAPCPVLVVPGAEE